MLISSRHFRLVDASRKLDTDEGAETLRSIADHLHRLGAFSQACDILRRLNDYPRLAGMLVSSASWTEALALSKQHPSLRKEVYLPYARWLAEQERFVESQQGDDDNKCLEYPSSESHLLISFMHAAFYEAGCTEEAERTLNTLAMNAVALNKYEDASHFFWLFAKHRLQLAAES